MTEKINLKKTAKAYDTISEDAEEVTKKMLDKKGTKEKEIDELEKLKLIEEAEETDKKEKKEAPDKRKRFNQAPTREEILTGWTPKTKLGLDVKEGRVKNLDDILDKGKKILEEQIVDTLTNVQSDLVAIGQSKGKFGGGKRRAWRQTQRKTEEGNVMTFSAMAVVGDEKGHLGIGTGKAKETLPARDKAIRKAKLNIFKVVRSCASFDCNCSEKHTIPFEVWGKSGSVQIKLMPAPQGTGLVVADNIKALLRLAGIKDVYSKTFGKQRTTFNLVKACAQALKQTNKNSGEIKNE